MTTKKEQSNQEWLNPNAKLNSSYYRTYEASPIFTFRNSADILTTESWLVDFAMDNTDTQKFLPLTNLTITNNSTQDIYIYINQGTDAKIIPSGSIVSFTKSTIPAIRSLKVYNAGGGTASASTIEVSAYKEGVVIDDAFARMHKAFFKFLRFG